LGCDVYLRYDRHGSYVTTRDYPASLSDVMMALKG
jgi:hypothetical protein